MGKHHRGKKQPRDKSTEVSEVEERERIKENILKGIEFIKERLNNSL